MTTPTNEAGHGLPELPEPLISGGNDNSRPDLGRGCTGYTAAQVQQYAIDYAAALALSRGVPDGLKRYDHEVVGTYSHWEVRAHESPNGEWVRYADAWLAMFAAAPAAAGAQGEVQKMQVVPQQQGSDLAWTRLETWLGTFADSIPNVAYHELCAIQKLIATTPQPAAADGGVRERALGLLAAECGVSPEMVNEYQDRDVIVRLALRAIEKALTQQSALSSHRQAGDAVAVVHCDSFGTARMIWNKECTRDNRPAHGTKLYTAPPPGADLSKFRELAERWRVIGAGLSDDKSLAYQTCADDFLALVEKGAGS